MSQRDSKGKFAKARQLKVGDHVRGLRWTENIPATGKITGFCGDGDPFIEFPGGSALLKRDTVTHVKPAPQPKADDAKDAEIKRLKAEVERLKAHTKVLEQAEELAKLTAASACRRCDEAETKLADIKAIIRTFKLLSGAKIGSLEDAVGHALGDAA